MPVITQVKPQRNGKRVNIFLDNRFGFGIDLENFVTLNLKVEQELTDEEITEIVKKAEFQKTLDKLLRFAALRPRSEKEVNDWLRKKKVHESLFEELFSRLKRLELIDDKKFAKWWVEQRQAFRPKSLRILRQELGIKGITKDIVNEVLGSVKVDEEKIAGELLEKKKYRWRNLSIEKARQKMSQYLAGKGFGWDTINNVVDALEK